MTTFLAKQNFYDSILNKRVLYTTEFGKLWNWHMQIYNSNTNSKQQLVKACVTYLKLDTYVRRYINDKRKYLFDGILMKNK